MARISLRAYNRDIEAMIDKNQIDEAFAHCRYILELYPKHINTYRLMGKALLEAQRFSDAADVFQRVLSSVPDDFIAHLGMSIIREDESNIDAAIWHMERSFEVQPSNAAVQVELRRLYGLRDGVTPQKIQLTRGALARMSAKSNLHSQAIAELRSALSSDPQRPDLQVVLAEMYQQTGARMEAIETCNALINKLPYCLTANRILAEILPETERADQAHQYKNRLGELDPYYLQLSPVSPTLEQVPDGAVTIERFEYDGEAFESADTEQPAWAASLGVDLDDQNEPEEAVPEWLEKSESEVDMAASPEAETASEPEVIDEPELSKDEQEEEIEDVPDWFKELDDSDTDAESIPEEETRPPPTEVEEVEESQPFISQEASVDIIEEVEQTPDWMREESEADEQDESVSIPGIAAAAGAAALGAAFTDEDDDGTGVESDAELGTDATDKTEDAEPLPEWMTEVEQQEDLQTAEEIDEFAESPGEPEQEELEQEKSPAALEEPEDIQEIPDWMSEAEPESEVETPDWLKDAMEGSEEEHEPALASAAAGAAIMAGDDEFDQELDSDSEMESEITPPPDPETLYEEAVEVVEPPVTGDVEEIIEEDKPSSEDLPEDAGLVESETALAGAALAGAAIGASLAEDDDLDGEFEERAGPVSDGDFAPTSSEDEGITESEEEVPDWLQELGEDLPGDAEPAESPLVFEDQPALEVSEIEAVEDEIVSEGITEPAAEHFEDDEFPESIPDWLSEVSPEEIPQEIAEAEAGLDIVRAEIPVWLRKMEAQHKAELEAGKEIDRFEELELEAEFTELSGEDVPSWLMSAMEPELADEVEQLEAVEEISEVIETEEPVSIDELGPEDLLAEDLKLEGLEEAAEDLEADQVEEILTPLETASEPIIESDEPAIEPEAEILVEDALDTEGEEDEGEGVSVAGLAAAGVAGIIADELLDEEDTQPIAVADEPEPTGDLEAEEIGEEALLVPEPDLVDEIEQLAPDAGEDVPLPTEIEEAEMPALAADAPLTGDDEDAAMAWLESLAAKQGAAEEELLTPADERLEEPPDWVQEEAAEDERLDEEDVEERDTALTAAALAGVTAGILAGDEEPDEERGELEREVEDLDQVPSEWVLEEEQAAEMESEPTVEEVEIEPESLEYEEDTSVVEELAAAAEIELDQVESEETSEEIPGWLSGLAEEQDAAVEQETTEWTPDMTVEEVGEPAAPTVDEEIEKIDLNAASLSQLEKIPGIGFIHAQNIINHRTESGSFTDLDQLGDVEGLTPEMVADLNEYLTIEVVTEVPTTSDSEIPELQDAWKDIDEGNIDQSIEKYMDLINQDQHLDEVISDLQAAINKYPSNSALYQCLGDAYMHTNMLQEALDAYNRAEDLI